MGEKSQFYPKNPKQQCSRGGGGCNLYHDSAATACESSILDVLKTALLLCYTALLATMFLTLFSLSFVQL